MFAIGHDTGTEIDWLKTDKGEVVVFKSRQQAKDQLRQLGLKRKNFLIVPLDSDDLATFFVNYMYEKEAL